MDEKETTRRSLDELIHSFNIIQSQLLKSNEQQREIIRKMSTKQNLLLESRQNLQEQLGTSLLEDYSKKKKKRLDTSARTATEKDLVPIITTGSSIIAAEPAEDKHNTKVQGAEENIRLIKCQGWIRENRIWIQAQCHVLSGINQAQICCIPTTYLPETTISNTNYNLQQQAICEFYMTFDLLPDISIPKLKNELKVSCLIDQMTTKTCCDIEWILEQDDLTWAKQMVSILSANEFNVIQAYFPCHIRVTKQEKVDLVGYINNKGVECTKYNENILIPKNQKWIIHVLSKDNYFNLYGLTDRITAKIATTLFSNHTFNTTKKTLCQNQELIKALGDEVITLTKKINPDSRINTAMTLSQY